jgi:chemotaxis family two-component system sensor kinase Cph1
VTGPSGIQAGLDELLRRCESEPIHTPGSIQPHGALLRTDRDRVVRVASEQLDLLGTTPEAVLGRPLSEVLGEDLSSTMSRFAVGEAFSGTGPTGDAVDVLTHAAGDGLLVEVEEPSPVDVTERAGIGTMLRRLQSAASVGALLDLIVEQTRSLTGFDRVMAYRFDEEWNGTVVAESAAEGLGSFLGLRYPSSDIPPQARALYLRNRVRLIPEVAHEPVGLRTDGLAPEQVDLSDATLRAVSPVHLEYLHNMGVRASGSAALVVGGQLWGLVACHHYDGPRRPSQRLRLLLDVLCGTASALLGGLQTTAGALERLSLTASLDELTAPLFDEQVPDPIAALDHGGALALLAADGLVVSVDGRVALAAGALPDDDALRDLLAELARGEQPVATDRLADTHPHLLGDRAGDTAGLLASRWRGRSDWVVALRRERVRSVRWGGDPAHSQVVVEPEGARLGPRRSFEEYVETVRGTSDPWDEAHREAARELGRRVETAVSSRERRDRSVASLMQRALLLDGVPAVPGADVAVTYRPAQGEGLGGDWYDVYFGPSGRVVIALGDVAGHGMDVAATMSQLRHALRAYTMSEADLSASMVRLNQLCCELLPRDMATLLVASLDVDAGTIEVINAGHLPPVVGRAAGGAGLAELHRNPALGISRRATFTSSRLDLGAGDRLVACTDGLIEQRRAATLDEQLARLVDAVADGGQRSSQQLCEELDRAFAPDGSDDVTVLSLRLL